MIKTRLDLFFLINITLLLALIFLLSFRYLDPDKPIVYSDNIKLFDGFNITKEMKHIGKKEFNARKASVDSLYTKVQSPTISDKDKKIVMKQSIQCREILEQFNQIFDLEQYSKIWSRIQSYLDAFSKNKQEILYADQSVAITNELLT